jgi:hypothetical protein
LRPGAAPFERYNEAMRSKTETAARRLVAEIHRATDGQPSHSKTIGASRLSTDATADLC